MRDQSTPSSEKGRKRREKFAPGRARTILWLGGAPALFAILVFANTLVNGFAYDDIWIVNRLEKVDISMSNVLSGRGLTYAVHELDRLLWGNWSPGFHLTNILLHSLASALAAFAAYALTRSRRIALFCSLVFAVHPVHTEAVASFANRKDILAMIFVSMALILWLRRSRTLWNYSGALVCYGLALFFKEVAAAALPAMFFLADLIVDRARDDRLKNRFRRAAVRLAPILVLGLVVAVTMTGMNIPKYFAPKSIHEYTGGQCQNYESVLATSAASVPDQVRLLIYPLHLSVDYPMRPESSLTEPRPALGLVFAALWVVASLVLLRRSAAAGFAMFWVFVMFLPCSNVVPLTQYFLAERYLYVPSFGLCLLLAIGFDRSLAFARRKRLDELWVGIVALSVLLIAAGGARSMVRNRDWRDECSLWSSSIRAGCSTVRAHNNLGRALADRGRLDDAVGHYSEALRLNPNYWEAHNNLGVALMRQGRLEDAVGHYSEALRLNPRYALAWNNMGTALQNQGKLDKAIASYAEALRLDPGYAEAHNNLGLALSKQGKLDEAIASYSEALRLNPRHAEAHNNLGIALLTQGKVEEAIGHFFEAVRIDPNSARAQSNLGTALAEQGKLSDAIRHFSEALEMDPNLAEAHCNIGVLFEKQGEFDKAARHFTEALRIRPDFDKARTHLDQISGLRHHNDP